MDSLEGMLVKLGKQCYDDHWKMAEFLDHFQIKEVRPLITETPTGHPAEIDSEAVWMSSGTLSVYAIVVVVAYDKRGYLADYGYDLVSREWHCWSD